jgi:sugar fermentation stimulation protein A
VAAQLIDNGMVPGLEGWQVERSEVVPPGLHSRFDFLLSHRDDPRRQRYLEVKSCTLFNGEWALFPDAVSDRARRHVEELVTTGASTGVPGVVLVLVHSPAVRFFSPDVHVDLAFSRTLAQHRDALELVPLGLSWDAGLSLAATPRRLAVPWERILPALDDRGSYLLLLELPHPRRITVGALGTREFPSGFYVYVGSAQRGLSRRIARHRRKPGQRPHWHIDYLRREAAITASWAIREPHRREEEIAEAVAALADGSEPDFGSSDSSQPSHLFYWSTDPRRNRSFQELILELRRFGFTAPQNPGLPPKRSPESD